MGVDKFKKFEKLKKVCLLFLNTYCKKKFALIRSTRGWNASTTISFPFVFIYTYNSSINWHSLKKIVIYCSSIKILLISNKNVNPTNINIQNVEGKGFEFVIWMWKSPKTKITLLGFSSLPTGCLETKFGHFSLFIKFSN